MLGMDLLKKKKKAKSKEATSILLDNVPSH